MPITKLRELAKFGIVTDVDPFDLPFGAFSAGVNVRFKDGKVRESPVFRNAGEIDDDQPRFMSTVTTSGFDSIFIGYQDGVIRKFTAGVETDVSIGGYAPADSEGVYTSAVLSRVLYFNRQDRVPWAFVPAATDFVALANWTSNWRTRVLRSFNSSLVALNVTKDGVHYPTMVKVSDFAFDGTVPATWDETDPTANSYENVIAEMRGDIVEGQSLRDAFVIYSNRETWIMESTGDGSLYALRRLFLNAGCINANCAVEVDGMHYVFGVNDIWRHDGLSKVSIADGKTRQFIFDGIDTTLSHRCFVLHNPEMREIYFCYVSGDRLVNFENTAGCNRAAVFDYGTETWTFDDLPSVFAGDSCSMDSALTWTNITGVWQTQGGTWAGLEGGFKKGVVYVGNTEATQGLTAKLYPFDWYSFGSVFSSPIEPTANPALYLERDGIDLDELAEELRGYKTVLSVWPQARIDTEAEADLEFSFGSSDGFNEPAVFTDYMTYNGVDLRKLDYKNAGRFLSMRILYDDYRPITLTGLDLDLKVTGRYG